MQKEDRLGLSINSLANKKKHSDTNLNKKI